MASQFVKLPVPPLDPFLNNGSFVKLPSPLQFPNTTPIYFSDQGSDAFFDAANWFSNAACTVPLGRAAMDGDYCIIVNLGGAGGGFVDSPNISLLGYIGSIPADGGSSSTGINILPHGMLHVSNGGFGGTTDPLAQTAIIDSARLFGTVNGNAIFINTATCAQGPGVVGNADFYNGSNNSQGGGVQGIATFHDNSYNDNSANLNGTGIFLDNSANQGNCFGDAKFFNSSVNAGVCQVSATFNDNSVNQAAAFGATFNGNSYNNGNTFGATFNPGTRNENNCFNSTFNNAFNDSGATANGTTIFNGSSINLGDCPDYAEFHGTSSNQWTVENGNADAIFYDASSNQAQVTGTPTFNNTSFNGAFVVGDAIFNNSSQLRVGGTVSGTATFNNSASNLAGNGATGHTVCNTTGTCTPH